MKLEKILLINQFNPRNLVTSHEIFSKKSVSTTVEDRKVEQKRFADDSLFSKRIFGDMDSEEDYSCECGRLQTKFYNETICPFCGKPVEFVRNEHRQVWMDRSFII